MNVSPTTRAQVDAALAQLRTRLVAVDSGLPLQPPVDHAAPPVGRSFEAPAPDLTAIAPSGHDAPSASAPSDGEATPDVATDAEYRRSVVDATVREHSFVVDGDSATDAPAADDTAEELPSELGTARPVAPDAQPLPAPQPHAPVRMVSSFGGAGRGKPAVRPPPSSGLCSGRGSAGVLSVRELLRLVDATGLTQAQQAQLLATGGAAFGRISAEQRAAPRSRGVERYPSILGQHPRRGRMFLPAVDDVLASLRDLSAS